MKGLGGAKGEATAEVQADTAAEEAQEEVAEEEAAETWKVVAEAAAETATEAEAEVAAAVASCGDSGGCGDGGGGCGGGCCSGCCGCSASVCDGSWSEPRERGGRCCCAMRRALRSAAARCSPTATKLSRLERSARRRCSLSRASRSCCRPVQRSSCRTSELQMGRLQFEGTTSSRAPSVGVLAVLEPADCGRGRVVALTVLLRIAAATSLAGLLSAELLLP